MKRFEYYATIIGISCLIVWLVFTLININTLELEKAQKQINEQDIRIRILESKALSKDTVIINLNLNQKKW